MLRMETRLTVKAGMDALLDALEVSLESNPPAAQMCQADLSRLEHLTGLYRDRLEAAATKRKTLLANQRAKA